MRQSLPTDVIAVLRKWLADNVVDTYTGSHIAEFASDLLSVVGINPVRLHVEEFMQKMGQSILPSPQQPVDNVVRLRSKLFAEEVTEALEALHTEAASFEATMDEVLEAIARHHPKDKKLTLQRAAYACFKAAIEDIPVGKVNIVAFADACADTDYVVEGARRAFGIIGEPIALIVHAANMRKIGLKREDGKVIKQADFIAPEEQITKELSRQCGIETIVVKPTGWTGPEDEIEKELVGQAWSGPETLRGVDLATGQDKTVEVTVEVKEDGSQKIIGVKEMVKCSCCDRGDEYNGFASGPTTFTCPKHCPCHD